MMTAASAFGQVAGGTLGDRLDKRCPADGQMLAHVCAMVILVTWISFEAIASVVHGVGWSVRRPLLVGFVADRTRSYALAFAALAMIRASGSVDFFVLGRPRSAVPIGAATTGDPEVHNDKER